MRAVYRSGLVLCALAAAGACRRAETPGPAIEASLAPRPYPLETLLASRSHELLELDPESGGVIYRSSGGARYRWSPGQSRGAIAPPLPLVAAAAERALERRPPAPAGFEIAAGSADGARFALRRALHPEADEIVLLERTSGEMRLLLPSGADARFRPIAFSRDGAELLLATDEGADIARLEWLELASGSRRSAAPRSAASASCELLDAALSADGRSIAVVESCAGSREARLVAAADGSAKALPLLPRATRALALALGADGEVAVATVASPRLPRDLVAFPPPRREAQPLTWGLAPGIDPNLLSAPLQLRVRAGEIPLELWLPSPTRPPGAAAVLWLEGDDRPPAWNEFHPLFQFLAGRGIAVARIRPRGSDGFGRAFRHAADGRLLAAAIEDLRAVLGELERQGVRAGRLALVGQGAWPGSLAAAIAAGRVDGSPRFDAIVALAADPDPLRKLDELAGLSEPAQSWWTERLIGVDAAGAVAVRERLRAPPEDPERPANPAALALAAESADDFATLWRFLAPRLAP